MPKLEDIERFKVTLNSLGGEPDILKEKGEEIEDPGLPEESVLSDLSDLFEGSGEEKASVESEVEAEGPTEEEITERERETFEEGVEGFEMPEDIGSDLSSEIEGEKEEEESLVNEELPDLDFDSLFGEETETSKEEKTEAEGVTGEEEGIGEPGDEFIEEAFGDIMGEELSVSEEPEVSEKTEEVEGEVAETAPEEKIEEEEFNLDSLELPDFESEFAEEGEGEIGAEKEEGKAEGGVEVGGEDEFSFSEEAVSEEPFSESGESVSEEETAGEAESEESFDFDIEGLGADEFEGSFETPEAEGGVGSTEEERGGEEEKPIEGGIPEEEMGFGDEFEEGIEGGEEDFVLDEFSLPDFGDEEEEEKKEGIPGLDETLKGLGPELGEEIVPSELVEGEEAEEGEGEEEIKITEEQFGRFKKTLNSLPINLKVAVEELITSGKAKGEKLKRLINILVAGASAKEIARLVSDITGKKIKIPRAYEKKAGIQFEEERKSFAYAFRENILPVAISVFLTLAILGVFSFLGYWFVYRPVHAISLYKKGYAYIEKDEYRDANKNFDAARKIWNLKSWYYKYAEGYIEKDQYLLAEEKYEQLKRNFPGDKKGLLSYARLESKYLANYEKADTLLNEILDKDNADYDALLAKGDNFMEWAKEDPAKYEKARFNYALILQNYGDVREVLFRMLRYFVRTDQEVEAERLFKILDSDKKGKVDPEAYAELAGYFIDKGRHDSKKLELVPDILDRAMDEKMDMPEIHYQWARFYREVEKPSEEMKALNYVLYLLKDKTPLSADILKMKVDSYNRLGEIYYRKKEIINAEENFQRAVNLAENSLKRRILKPNKMFGSAFNNLGNIYYYVDNDLNKARIFFNKALENKYVTPALNYKLGYIDYAQKRYKDALLKFASVGVDLPRNWNVLFAMSNTLYLREDYSGAQGYYLDLLEKLENKRDKIQFLQPQTNPDHLALIKYFIRVYNNLGVTLYRLSLQTGDRKKFSEGLVNLTHSAEYYDILTRNQITMERSAAKGLSYLNMNGLLHPNLKYEPQIYWRIPKDPSQLNF